MRIRDLVWHDNRKAGHWRVTTDDHRRRTIWHYGTAMLSFDVCADGSPDLDSLDYSIGHGSVSDQQAMNQMFRAINCPLYFSRKGGARIE
jgi:hypothetical protein